MKKNLRNSKVNRIKKKALSIATAFTVLVGSIPMSDISDTVRKLTDKLFVPLFASAYDKYDVADYTTKDSEGRIRISDWGALQRYSKAYYEASQGTYGEGVTHKNDTILIAISEQAGSTFDLSGGFEPIGNDTEPFEGKLLFETGSPDTFNVDCPIFGTVSEKVKIAEKADEAVPRTITIKRTIDTPGVPLLAYKVTSDNNASTHSDWSLVFESYDSSTEVTYAGVINEMEDGANVELTVANNALQGKSDIKSDQNVGAVCGTLGNNATLTVTYSGTNSDYSIVSTGGHAGGFVGYIGEGSTLSITTGANLQSTAGTLIKSEKGYAGGIVGYNNAGTVSMTLNSVSTYDIQEEIVGNNGAGGIFGKYTAPAGTTTFDISQYYLNSKINSFSSGSGNVGGLIGELTTTIGCDLTISGGQSGTTVTSTHGGNSGLIAKYYGGIIGQYSASVVSDSVAIQNVIVVANNELSAANYGGGIGKAAGSSYVKFDDFKLSNAAGDRSGAFGGLVADAEGAYVYSKDVCIGSDSAISGFTDGGLIGKLGNGVLGMTGIVDLSNAQPTAAAANGQIVGKRDNALIYAENITASDSVPASSWTYTPSLIEVDNVGSWGDVIYFDGAKLVKSDVIASETNHVITFNTANTTAIDSVADYAIVSLLFQIDPEYNSFINGTQLSENEALTFADDIDLSGTGLRGITRDNESRITYSGTITGGSKTVTLDIKNIGGNDDRPVYYHRYNGLLGRASSVTVENLYLDGTIKVKPKEDNKYIGAFSATAQGTLKATGCKTLSTLNIDITNSSSYVAGRFVGLANKTNDVTSGMNTIDISGCEFDGTISGGGDRSIGGVFGKLGVADSVSPEWKFDNVSLKGSVTGVRSVGGLVAEVSGGNRATIKLVGTGTSATGVVADGITVSGSGNSMGGLLGYSWLNTDVEVTSVSISNSPTVSYSGTGGTAGLVYCATGHWTVTGLDMSGIKMSAASAKNIGMIVNKGTNGSGTNKSGIYLELPSGYSYKLSFTDDSDTTAVTVFDELCAYSADNSSNIMTNKQGIVSISTSGLKMESTAENSLSYNNQTQEGAKANPNTRYYYNLDLIDTDTTGTRMYSDLSSASAKLMRWGAYCYAAENIKKNFKVDNSDTFSFSASDSYDMKGYSWYPVTLDSSTTVAGTFKFYNKEFTECEESKSTDNKWYPNETSPTTNQHYMMQNGLFYNVTNNLTIGAVVLQGNIGATGTSGTGALVYGTVSGSSSASNDITTIDSTGTGSSISLDGIKIWNYKTVSEDYAPLLINKTGSFVNLKISNVSTTATYGAGDEAATSLIGYAGADDKDTYITVDFTKIKLDARTGSGTPALSNHGYPTTKSIFTRATLLERLVGESGTYTYTYDDDWGSGNHNVTYGEEVGYTKTNKPNSQYPEQEQWYARASTSATKYATSYSAAPTNDTIIDTGFDSFLPYVATFSTADAITAGTGKYYQLKVNHQPTDVIEGCGTYNDPYILKTEADIVKISRWISGYDLATATINANFGDTWCDNNKTEHSVYNGSSSGFTNAADSTDTRTNDAMRQYLCEAYYKIEPLSGNSITLSASSSFRGLGVQNAGYGFRGVIVGGDNISIINKTAFPLIAYSEGSVVKNLTITVDTSDLYINKKNDYKGQIYFNGMTGLYTNWNNTTEVPRNSYGSVIATIVGGDNIIDNVQVNLDAAKFWLHGVNAQYTAIGGYVGVIIDGGLVFRNMSGSISGLTDNTKITNDQSKTTTTMIDSDNNVWMFVNPIIGRVINGYAVTESSSGYKPREADVTMKNSTGDHTVVKNYSITDIATSGSTLSVNRDDKKITVPDSQAFVLMSYIVNSGMGADLLGYSKTSGTNYFMRRHGQYSDVGSTASSSSDCSDYNTLAKNDSLDSTPYLISAYAGGSAPIGSDNWTVELVKNGNYDLSDGFRGIGNFFNDNDSLRLNVDKFNGNGSKINQNTKYYYYSSDCANDYKPADTQYAGIGLFTCLNTNGKFDNFKLTGSVKCDCLLISNGEHIEYKANDTTNKGRQLSAAMLFATVKEKCYPSIDSAALQNVEVRGVRHTGGLIGNLPQTNTNIVTIKNTQRYDSTGISVHGAGSVGGLVGRNQQGVIQVDLNNCHFDIKEIVSECSVRDGNGYDYGVGGFIGICRTGFNLTVNNKIENVIIGTNDKQATVNCNTGGQIFVGGVVGVINRANVDVNNCTFYNISVESKDFAAGGLVADCITDSTPTVTNTKLISSKDSEIIGSTYCGGFIGNTDERSDGGATFVLKNSSIEGYIIQGQNAAGGIIGYRGASGDSAILQIENVKVDDCTIKSNTSAGVIAGEMKHPIQGYNIFCNDIGFDTVSGSGSITNNGYIVGLNSDSKNIKLVGFSRQEELEEGEDSEMVQDIVGDGGVGSDGYVIFADNQGLVSNETATTSVDIATEKPEVTFAKPFVTINPKTELDATKFLTGDGANTSAINAIYKAIEDETPGYYSIASDVAADTKLKYSSSFKSEMGSKNFETGKDFPVLIVDDINDTNTTALINNYIALLTNTDPYNATTGKGYNYASTVDNGVSKTVIHKCTFNEAGTELTIKPGQTEIPKTSLSTADNNVPCLKRSGSQFSMVAKDTDTAADTAQFTLLDIQYFDPSTVTWSGSNANVTDAKIAYHLYIPIYVRKVLEYDFDIHVESGSSYKINPATSLVENTLIENIGVPITLEFAFTYKRTADEWVKAANAGDSLLSNYPKSLLFDNSTKEVNGARPYLPNTTKMVLIDTQNNSKAYYLDSYTGSSSAASLNFSDFSNGGAFSPKDFNDMMIVTVKPDTSGTLVKTSEHPGTATLVDNSTSTRVEYRPIAENETGIPDSDKYSVDSIILGKDAEHPAERLEEHYFLTIYTQYLSNDVVYHYSIGAAKHLGTDPYPSRITTVSENNAANLFLGDIYDQTVYIDKLSVGDSETKYCVDAENSELSADLRSTISITEGAENNGILTYLGSTNPPTIYESLSVQFDKYRGSDSDIGIKGVNNVDVTSYKINNDPVKKYNSGWNSVNDTTTNSTYIEMRNNVPLASLLVEGTVVVEASVTVSFDTENGGITEQFYPETPATNGTKVIALSKMSSNLNATAYSKVLDKTDKLSDQSSSPGTTNRYYTNDSETAELTYDAVEIYNEGQIPQLGINANDKDDIKKLPAEIKTNGSYDVEKCQSAWATATKVRCKIELKTIDDNYSTDKNIFDYIDKDTFSVFNGITPDTKGTTDNVLIYTYNKSDLSAYYQDKTYQIPITFKVLSGSEFEKAGLKYANYGIFLTVSLIDDQDNAVLSRTDYVKFTNARIYIEDKVTP